LNYAREEWFDTVFRYGVMCKAWSIMVSRGVFQKGRSPAELTCCAMILNMPFASLLKKACRSSNQYRAVSSHENQINRSLEQLHRCMSASTHYSPVMMAQIGAGSQLSLVRHFRQLAELWHSYSEKVSLPLKAPRVIGALGCRGNNLCPVSSLTKRISGRLKVRKLTSIGGLE